MIAAKRRDRVAGTFAAGLFAAALGFGIGPFGPLGFLAFQACLPFMLFTAGPGTARIAWGLTAFMEKRASRAASVGELRRVALLLVLPLAGLQPGATP